MPAFYAHNRFGIQVREQMKEELGSIASRYDSAYQTGLQGPDIFFFYHPWHSTRVRRYGTRLHEANAAPFFRHAISVVREQGRDSSAYAYLLGFLCHFILDSECHPYITDYISSSGVAHLEIEAEFEKTLLRLDGRDPVGWPISRQIVCDRETAKSIVPFYPSMNEELIVQSLRGMKLVKRIFTAPGRVRQGLINTIMKKTGSYHEMNGLMNQRTDNPLCQESNEVLLSKFDAAVPLAVSIQEQFDACVRTGVRLPQRFHRNFE